MVVVVVGGGASIENRWCGKLLLEDPKWTAQKDFKSTTMGEFSVFTLHCPPSCLLIVFQNSSKDSPVL